MGFNGWCVQPDVMTVLQSQARRIVSGTQPSINMCSVWLCAGAVAAAPAMRKPVKYWTAEEEDIVVNKHSKGTTWASEARAPLFTLLLFPPAAALPCCA